MGLLFLAFQSFFCMLFSFLSAFLICLTIRDLLIYVHAMIFLVNPVES
jgi:hypothetical protein